MKTNSKKRSVKRILSAFLALLMLILILPVNIFATLAADSATVSVAEQEEEQDDPEETSSEEETELKEQTIAFDESEYTIYTGEDFDAPAAYVTSENYGTGEITYAVTSDDNKIIDDIKSDTGKVTLTYRAGTATITATMAADDSYKEATAEYTLIVEEWEPQEECYEILGDTINDSGWFAGNVSIAAKEGYQISDKQTNGDADWKQELKVTEDGENTVSFYIKNSDGYISKQYTETVKKDGTAPTAEIQAEGLNGWEKLLSIITFGEWGKDKVDLTIDSKDATSGVANIVYYIDDDTEKLGAEELDKIDTWEDYEGGISIEKDTIAVVYAKVTDKAGNYVYASTNGIVFEGIEPAADIEVLTKDYNGFYNGNVELKVSANDAEPYSGIRKIEYWVTCDDKKTQSGTLFTFNEDDPQYSDLVHNWDSEKNDKKIIIDSALNEGDHVKAVVEVTDNAGNVSRCESDEFKIDVTAPKIGIDYDEKDPYTTEDGREYYGTDRTATIYITDRNPYFDAGRATNGITFSGTDSNGMTVELNPDLMIGEEWIAVEGKNPGETIYKNTVKFTADANYVLNVEYTDQAGNKCVYEEGTSATQYFTVDKTDPTAEIRISGRVWTKLLEILTFGIWSNDKFEVSAASWDKTSPVVTEYYISDRDTQLTENDLKGLAEEEWKEYKAFTVDAQRQFSVYLRVTDYAGNRIFLNSDGHVLDKTASLIKFIPDPTSITHNGIGVYNKDVNVQINVTEKEPYSGIKTVEYWVLCDGERTQEDILYSYDSEEAGTSPTKEELTSSFSRTITVDAKKNNSCNVVVYVGVMDNAGNYSEGHAALDIDITAPVIRVTYDNNDAYKTVSAKGYFPAKRTATAVITERTAHFNGKDATNGIKITAKDANGKTVIEECSSLIGSWKTVEGKTADAATHTAAISYSADANYTFAISYTDKAANGNKTVDTADSVTPYSFAVDKTAPTGTITVGKLGTWDKLVKTLSFGLWSSGTVKVSGTSTDITSPIESVTYYKTADTSAKTARELSQIQEWKKFSGFKVKANEQFAVYLRIVDYAGNITYISSDGVIVDNAEPVVESIKPKITITPEQPVNGIYHTDVKVAVKVEDSKNGDTNAYSGLKEIRYEVYNMGKMMQNGTLYSFTLASPKQSQLRQVWEKKAAIVVDKKLNNSNDVEIKVYAVDNAGNKSEASEAVKIDITNPAIEVSYDNNDGDTTFAENSTDAFFKADRTATITITERNFDPDQVVITVTNTQDVIPKISGWTKKQESGNGDRTTHTATLTYSEDGDYSFAVSCTDKAGNANGTVNYGDSLAPEKFTVDKTLPVVSVTYDNNTAQNGNYYNEARTAAITVTEHNFETSRINIALNATDDGQPAALPTVSSWTSSGDVHTATITYAADSLYTFDFDYEDKAGNASADMPEQSFYVDRTNPVLSITKIADESANNEEGDIGFIITAKDTNFGEFTPVLIAVVKEGDRFVTEQLDIGTTTNIDNGKEYTVTNLDADGIYRITCTVIDKAGNEYSEVTLSHEDGSSYVENRSGEDTLITFSVNRDGSTYEIDEKTVDLAEKYYVQNVAEDVVVIEINADPLQEYDVNLNGKTLTEDTDYKVSQEGGNGEWIKYTYTINKTLFAEEGEYKVVVSSKDKAGNDAFSDVKEATVNFVVDRTAPIVTVTGLAENGRYQVEKQTVTLIPADDGGALKSLIVCLVDDDGNSLKELIHLEGDALAEALENASGKIAFEIEEGLYQNVQIICDDYAVDEKGDTNTYIGTFANISVSSSIFMIFWANKPLRYGVMGGILLVIASGALLIVLRKRKRR